MGNRGPPKFKKGFQSIVTMVRDFTIVQSDPNLFIYTFPAVTDPDND